MNNLLNPNWITNCNYSYSKQIVTRIGLLIVIILIEKIKYSVGPIHEVSIPVIVNMEF